MKSKLIQHFITVVSVVLFLILIGAPKIVFFASSASSKNITDGGSVALTVGSPTSLEFFSAQKSIAVSVLDLVSGVDFGLTSECYSDIRRARWRNPSIVFGPDQTEYLKYSNKNNHLLIARTGQVFVAPVSKKNIYASAELCGEFLPELFTKLQAGIELKEALELPEFPVEISWSEEQVNKKHQLLITALKEGNFEIRVGQFKGQARASNARKVRWNKVFSVTATTTPTQVEPQPSVSASPAPTNQPVASATPQQSPTATATPVPVEICGNGTCAESEDPQSCPEDCAKTEVVCGNGIKEGDEQCDGTDFGVEHIQDPGLVCKDDCTITHCGNNLCEVQYEEDQYSCPQDCPTAPPYCGDGLVQGGEECDDGNQDNYDGCTSCALPVCGDVHCEPGEESCTECMHGDPICGDNICGFGINVEGGTETCQNCPEDCGVCETCPNAVCDEGENSQTCPQDCVGIPPLCGNGIKEDGEECDGQDFGVDYDRDPGLVCGEDCRIVHCGNNLCEPNFKEDQYSCPQDCPTAPPYCGDGLVQGAEECDDGNQDSFDGCTECLLPVCGDQHCEPGEESCTECMHGDPICGDNICGFGINVEGGTETCQNCPEDCGACETCPNEVCDEGENSQTCPQDCVGIPPLCGNGIKEAEEECDGQDFGADYYYDPGLICGEDCRIVHCGNNLCESNFKEDPYSCPQDCVQTPSCGNGIKEEGEACDGGDFGVEFIIGVQPICKQDCSMTYCSNGTCDHEFSEDGYNCPQDCPVEPYCGNGIKENDEQCDRQDFGDGNVVEPNIVCNESCLIEQVGYCGDSVCDPGEESQGCSDCLIETF